MEIRKNLALSETGFVFDPSSGDSYSMNPQGLEMISLLKEGKTTDQIKTHFLERYLIDGDSLEKDLYDFVNVLKRFNLATENE